MINKISEGKAGHRDLADSSEIHTKKTSDGYFIPGGYKSTEVGIIPSDWDVKSLASLAEIRSGIAKNSNAKISNPISVYYLRVANVQDGFLDLSNMATLQVNSDDIKRYSVLPGDMLMNEGGDLDKLGRGTLWRGEYSPCIHQNHVFVVRCRSSLSPSYLNAWTGAPAARKYFLLAGRQTTNLASINKTSLGQLPIPLPSCFEEQTAIANALSDVDALINSLEKLIAKKQAIKTATMQQLLTGKTRLPQFATHPDGTLKGYKQTELGEIPEDWEVVELKDAVDFLDGLRKPVRSGDRAKISGIYPYYGASGIVDYVNDYLFDDELILLGEDGENILSRNLPLAFRVSGKIWVNNHAHVMKPKTIFDIDYLTEYLEILDYSLVNSGTAQPKLNKQSCLKIKILKPCKEEQNSIAAAISDINGEIHKLQLQLAKSRQIKQGMMQELLTGKTRLLKPVSEQVNAL